METDSRNPGNSLFTYSMGIQIIPIPINTPFILIRLDNPNANMSFFSIL